MHTEVFSYTAGARYDCPVDWTWNLSGMRDYDIWLVLSGKGRMEVCGDAYDISGGDCFIFKPGASLSAFHDPEYPLQVYAAHFDLISSSIADLGADGKQYLHSKLKDPSMSAGLLALAIGNAQNRMSDAANFWLKAAVLSFFEQRSDPAVFPDSGIASLCAEIEKHPERNWTMKLISSKLKYSQDHCRRLFIQHSGLPPLEYVIRRRVERASFLLTHTDMTIAEIAFELNYQNIYYFSRQFKKFAGIPPGSYRKAHAC